MGDYPALGLSDARGMARELKVRIKNGADPLAERRAAKSMEAEPADGLGNLITRCLREHAANHLAPRTHDEYERALTALDIQELCQIPAANVTAFDVAKWLDKIEKRGALVQCNRAQTYLSAVYSWAAPRRRAGVVSNPVKGLTRRFNEGGREKRWLNEDKIKAVFGALPKILQADRPDVPRWAADVARWINVDWTAQVMVTSVNYGQP